MQERLDQPSRYNFRRNGYIDVHEGPLAGMTFDSNEHIFGVLSKAEDIANKLSTGLRLLSIPVVLFSAVETGAGIKEKRTSRVHKGVVGIGLALGLMLTAKIYEKRADEYSLEKDNIEDEYLKQPQAA